MAILTKVDAFAAMNSAISAAKSGDYASVLSLTNYT